MSAAVLTKGGGATSKRGALSDKPGAWVDLGLTLPVFLVYQFGVVFLSLHNATDMVTGLLLRLSEGNQAVYLLETASIGVVVAGIFAWLGRGEAFRASKFVQIALEGILYAVVMRIAAGYVVGHLALGSPATSLGLGPSIVMSAGAGFYEELAFRVILFGLGAKVLVRLLGDEELDLVKNGRRMTLRGFLITAGWAIVCAGLFSGMHYVGAYGDPFELGSFTFRFVLGLVLTLIFVLRGFAAGVWAHALYDLWVMAL